MHKGVRPIGVQSSDQTDWRPSIQPVIGKEELSAGGIKVAPRRPLLGDSGGGDPNENQVGRLQAPQPASTRAGRYSRNSTNTFIMGCLWVVRLFYFVFFLSCFLLFFIANPTSC